MVIESVTTLATICCILFSLVHLDIEAALKLFDFTAIVLCPHSHAREFAALQKRAIVSVNPFSISETFFLIGLSIFKIFEYVSLHFCQFVFALLKRPEIFFFKLLNFVSVRVEALFYNVLLSLLKCLSMQLCHSFDKMDNLFYLGARVSGHIFAMIFGLFYVFVNVVPECVDAKFVDLFVKALHVFLTLSHLFCIDCLSMNIAFFFFEIKHAFLLQVRQ